MQPDFFNMDVTRDSGDNRTVGSRKTERASGGDDRRSKIPVEKRSFAEALQEAADTTHGAAKNTPRRPDRINKHASGKTGDTDRSAAPRKPRTLVTGDDAGALPVSVPAPVVRTSRVTPLALAMPQNVEKATADVEAVAGDAAVVGKDGTPGGAHRVRNKQRAGSRADGRQGHHAVQKSPSMAGGAIARENGSVLRTTGTAAGSAPIDADERAISYKSGHSGQEGGAGARASVSSRPSSAPAGAPRTVTTSLFSASPAETAAGSPRTVTASLFTAAPAETAVGDGNTQAISSRGFRQSRPKASRVKEHERRGGNFIRPREAGALAAESGARPLGMVRAQGVSAFVLTPPAGETAALHTAGDMKTAGSEKKATTAQGKARQSAASGHSPQAFVTSAADGDAAGPTMLNRDTPAGNERTVAAPGGARMDSVAHHTATNAEIGAPRTVPTEVMQQIADKAAFMVKNGQESVRIQLNPESLGHINLKVSMEEGQVMIRMRVENPMTRDLLEHHIGQLRANLGQQGLTIDRLDLDLFSNNTPSGQSGDQAAKDGSSHFSGRRQSGQQAAEDTAGSDVPPVAWELDNSSTLVGLFA
ncbi:MAG: flagellar hook-length control protein FliK [Pseudomonadota bacterium]